jgi:N-methylhydantoinase A
MGESCVLGADIGGTFTDVVLTRADGSLCVAKQLSSPDAPERSVLAGVTRLLAEAGVEPSDISRVVHGTTMATNAVIERRGARVAFVTTEGFGDLLQIGREARVEDDRYDLHFQESAPPLPRSLSFEIPERLNAQGEILRPLDEAATREVVRRVAEQQPEAVALCLLHAYANPDHETRVEALLREALPDAVIVASSRVHPEIREFDRASTTLFTAEVAPLMARYLARLQEGLTGLGIGAPLHIMESSGGVMAASVAAERAVATLESGGAAGVMAAARLASHYGFERTISFDMGGTTAKAGVVENGRPRVVRELHVGGKGSFGGRRAGTGLPVKTPTIDLAEVGAGGGSVAWLDPEGVLQVGPRSAGAVPGPACYGQGGALPTVTDANLVLGYLDPQRFAGGTMKLDAGAGREAIAREIAGPLGIEVERAAWAIHEVANANMAAAIHVVTVQRGLDPRDHTLIAFGGAGPMHMVGVAQRFDIETIVAPPQAGVASAVGMQATDLTAEHGRTRVIEPEALTPDTAAEIFAEIEAVARAKMGFDAEEGELLVEHLVDARYAGQSHELSVPVENLGRESLGSVEAAYRERYRAAYGVAPAGDIEYAAFRVRLRVPVERPALQHIKAAAAGLPSGQTGRRPARFGPDVAVDTAVYDRDSLAAGAELAGPAVVEGSVETVVIPPGYAGRVATVGSLVLRRPSP